MAEDTQDQPASVLTPRQRRYLLEGAPDDMTPAAERAMRSRIRGRLRAGMADFDLVLNHLTPKDIQTALERRTYPKRGEREQGTPLSPEFQKEVQLENGMAAVIGLIFLASLERTGKEDGGDLTRTNFLRGRIKKGIRLALNALDVSVQQVIVDLVIELGREYSELADLEPPELAKYSETELLQARLDDAITNEQFMAAMNEKGLTVEREGE